MTDEGALRDHYRILYNDFMGTLLLKYTHQSHHHTNKVIMITYDGKQFLLFVLKMSRIKIGRTKTTTNIENINANLDHMMASYSCSAKPFLISEHMFLI